MEKPFIPNFSDPVQKAEHDYHAALAARRLPGPSYLANLQIIHDHLRPRTYLEIGVAVADSLRFAHPGCFAIGIDPGFLIDKSLPAWVRLFRLSSDDYFTRYDTRDVLGGKAVDFSFIDGLHTFDQVFRDLLNVMPFLAATSFVALHDVYPAHAVPAERVRKSLFWTGDVWKVVFLIREFFPDLEYMTIPAAPSGLFLIKGFDGKAPAIDNEKLSGRVAELLLETYDQHAPMLTTTLNVGLNNADHVRDWLGEAAHGAE